MPNLRIGQAADFLGVSPDTVRRWADAGRIATVRTGGGHRLVDSEDLARLAVRLAGDRRPTPTVSQSARNRFPGVVTRVLKDGVMAQVEMQAGPWRVVSLMSREAADELALRPGVLAIASVKATNVVIELPAQPAPAA